MADQNLDIVVRVRGGQVASSEIKGVAGSVEQVGTASAETSKKTSALRSSLGTLATGFAVYKGYQFIKSAVSETTSLARATAGLSRITGMDSQTASAWVEIAKERGVQSKQLNQGFITLSKNIVGVGQGSKPAIAAFQQLGIGTAALSRMKPEEVLNAVADAFQKMPNGADKAAAAQKLFGRQAQALLPLLNGGSAALNGQVDAMKKHLGMSQQSEKQALELAKQQRELSATMVGVKVAIATALLPILATLSKIIAPIAEAFAQLMTHSAAFRVAVIALTAALTSFIVIMKIVDLLGIEFEATWGLIPAILIGIGVALYLLYTKCAWFRNAVQAVLGGVVAAFNWVKNAAASVVNWVEGHWKTLLVLLPGIGPVLALVANNWKSLEGVVKSVASAITSAIKAIAQVVTSVLGAAFSAVKSIIDSIGTAIGTVVSVANKITSLPGKIANKLSFGLIGHADGGTVASGGEIALVGERGPEIVALPGGSTVIPNHALGGVGGVTHVTIPVHLDGYRVGKAFGSFVAGQQARR